MKVQSHIYVYAFCLIAVFTGCKGTKMQKKNCVEIMMVNNANPGDSTAFSIFDNDSTYSFCLSKSEKVLGAGHVLDEDIVADSLSAVLIAKAAWYPLYGKEQIDGEKPYIVTEHVRYWTVEGSLPEGSRGGTAHIVIRKSDGKVMSVWHEK